MPQNDNSSQAPETKRDKVIAAARDVVRTMQNRGNLDAMYGATLRLHLALHDYDEFEAALQQHLAELRDVMQDR